MAMATSRVSATAMGGGGLAPADTISLWTSRQGPGASPPSLPSLVSSSSGSVGGGSPPAPAWPAATVPSTKAPPAPSAVTVLPVADSLAPPPPGAVAAQPGSRGAREAASSASTAASGRRTSSAARRQQPRRSSSAARAAAAPPAVMLIEGGAVGPVAAPPPPLPGRRQQRDMAGGDGGGGGARGKRRSSAEQRLSAAASDVSVDKNDAAAGADPAVAAARKPTPALAIPVPKFVARPAGGPVPVDDWPADVADRPSSVTSLESLTASTSTDGAGARVGLPKAKVFMVRTPVPGGNDAETAAAAAETHPPRVPYDESLGLDEDDDEDEDENVFTEVASMATVSCTPAAAFDPTLDGPAAALPAAADARQASLATAAPPPPVRRCPPPAAAVPNRPPRAAPARSLKPPVPVPAGVAPGRSRTPRHYPRSQSRSQSAMAAGGDGHGRPADPSGPPQRVCSSSVAALWHGPVSLVDQPPSLGMAALRMESAPALAPGGPATGGPRRPSGRDWDDEDDAVGGAAPRPPPGGGGGTEVAVSSPPRRVGAAAAGAAAAAPVDAKTRYHRLRWWKNKTPAGNRQSDAATRRAAAVLHGESRRPAGQGRGGSIVDAACQVSMMADDFIEFATGGKLGAGGAAGSPAAGARADGGRAHRLLVRPLRWLQRSVQPVQSTQRIKGG